MKFSFTGIVKLTLDHTKGEKTSKHVSTDFLLEMSKGLQQSQYIDKDGLPTKNGCHILSRVFTSGLAAVIHHAHYKGYQNDVEHIKSATDELTRQFAISANTRPGILERLEPIEMNPETELSQFIQDETRHFKETVASGISPELTREFNYIIRYLETFEHRFNEFNSKNQSS